MTDVQVLLMFLFLDSKMAKQQLQKWEPRPWSFKSVLGGDAAGDARQLAALIGGDPMGNTGNNPLEVGEGILDLRTIARDHKFADALVMP